MAYYPFENMMQHHQYYSVFENYHIYHNYGYEDKLTETKDSDSTKNEDDEDSNDSLLESKVFRMENTLGMTVTSGSVVIKKDANNLIGISIGGGAPLCPCLYIVQVFDNTAACKDGTLQAGDELVAINAQSVKGKTKVEVAKMIQAAKDEVTINYNKLHADPKQGKTLDIVLKKAKHRLVENMSTSTADALGLSRAILCSDILVKKLKELQDTEFMYRGLVDHSKRVLQAYSELMQAIKSMGDVFASIAVREPQPRASEAFRLFGEQHRNMERLGHKMLKNVKPVLSDLETYLHKVIPDTRLTVKKYADAKFEYLAYCLKVKEMDDEECSYAALQEPLYRVETGNYEYRLILRCRQVARSNFANLRKVVLIKMEFLDNKHVEALGGHLAKLVKGLADLHNDTVELLSGPALFPVEVDLSNSAFQYKSTMPVFTHNDEENEDESIEQALEVSESSLADLSLADSTYTDLSPSKSPPPKSTLSNSSFSNSSLTKSSLTKSSLAKSSLANSVQSSTQKDELLPLIPDIPALESQEPDYEKMDNLTLLSTLNIKDTLNGKDGGILIPHLNN